jgi:hypothetical protein
VNEDRRQQGGAVNVISLDLARQLVADRHDRLNRSMLRRKTLRGLADRTHPARPTAVHPAPDIA